MGASESVAARCSEVEQALSPSRRPAPDAAQKAAARAGAVGQLEHWHQVMRQSDASQDLFDACTRGDVKGSMLALVAHAEPNSCNHDGLTPLMMAVAGGHLEVARLLVTSGSKVNSTPCPWGVSPVGLAAAQGSMAILELLLQWKGDTNLCAHTGNAPLTRAAGAGHMQACTKLLEYCADPDLQDAVGITAAMRATEHEHAQVVGLLLGSRASMAKVDHRSRSALSRTLDILLRLDPHSSKIVVGADLTSKYEVWSEVARRLVSDGGADANLADASGETLLSRATRLRRKDLMIILFGLGADQDFPVPALGGGTALMQAVREGDSDIVQSLVHRAASVNVPNGHGLSPLFLACDSGDEEVIRLLIKYNAETNRRDPRTGETLLIRLACRGFSSIYRELLMHTVVPAVRAGGDILPTTSRSEAGGATDDD